MTFTTPLARAALMNDADSNIALDRALTSLAGLDPDVLFLFASHHHAEHFASMLHETKRRLPAPIVIGCSGVGIVGMDRELEQQPALALLGLSLPGAKLATARLTQESMDSAQDA